MAVGEVGVALLEDVLPHELAVEVPVPRDGHVDQAGVLRPPLTLPGHDHRRGQAQEAPQGKRSHHVHGPLGYRQVVNVPLADLAVAQAALFR